MLEPSQTRAPWISTTARITNSSKVTNNLCTLFGFCTTDHPPKSLSCRRGFGILGRIRPIIWQPKPGPRLKKSMFLKQLRAMCWCWWALASCLVTADVQWSHLAPQKNNGSHGLSVLPVFLTVGSVPDHECQAATWNLGGRLGLAALRSPTPLPCQCDRSGELQLSNLKLSPSKAIFFRVKFPLKGSIYWCIFFHVYLEKIQGIELNLNKEMFRDVVGGLDRKANTWKWNLIKWIH